MSRTVSLIKKNQNVYTIAGFRLHPSLRRILILKIYGFTEKTIENKLFLLQRYLFGDNSVQTRQSRTQPQKNTFVYASLKRCLYSFLTKSNRTNEPFISSWKNVQKNSIADNWEAYFVL